MSRYEIWDKKTDVYTPSGVKFTSKQWIEKYPIAENDNAKIVCASGLINGAFFGVLSDMVNSYSNMGCDFSSCASERDFLDKIEEFEDKLNKQSEEPTTQERTAAALEFIAMSSLPDNSAE